MKKDYRYFFKPLPFLTEGKALLLRLFMLPNFLLTETYGLEHLFKNNGTLIYAFNHNNSFEALMVPALIIYHQGGRRISFVIDWMYGKIPIIGQIMDMSDPVYVYNKRTKIPWIAGKKPKAAQDNVIEQCTRKVLAGNSIGIFPEGKRNNHPEMLLKGKPGVAHIALRTGVPVIPVGIDFKTGLKRNKIPVIGRMTVRIGRPLSFRKESETYREIMSGSVASNSDRKQLSRIAEYVTHEIMISLAVLSGKQYRQPCPC
jgi:1-acyl-sn-glycerol-3-phosphate acyltransferase